MTNFYYYSTKFLALVAKNSELLDFIKLIEQTRNKLIFDPQEILRVENDTRQLAEAFQIQKQNISLINAEILNCIRTKRPNEIYILVNEIILDLNLFDRAYNDENSLIIALKNLPEKHTDAYSEKQADDIFNITSLCSQIYQSFYDIMERSKFIINEFNKSNKISPNNYSILRIGTDSELLLIDDFTTILESINDLYKIVSIIHQIDVKDYPIIINNISTGSWHGDFLGIKHVIESIERLILAFGGFMRDCITGKISREKFENECKKTDDFLNLISKAKELGINNADVGIFKGINPLLDKLVGNATVLDINGIEILKMREADKLTLVMEKKEREKLVEKINLEIGSKPDEKADNSQNKE